MLLMLCYKSLNLWTTRVTPNIESCEGIFLAFLSGNHTYWWKRLVQEHTDYHWRVVSSGGAPTPAGTSVFTKNNWDMGMGYLWLNGWGIYQLMGGAFMAYWVGHL